MSIQAEIQVNTYYTRSINLERDANNHTTVQAYIPTTRAIQTFARIADTLDATQAMPRAWALTGPYGSGKSLFAIFLSHLLGNAQASTTQLAQDILAETQPELAAVYQQATHTRQPCCTVLLTGSPAPLGQQLLRALAHSAEQYWQDKKIAGRPYKIIEKLQQAAQAEAYSIPEILELLKAFQKKLAATDCMSVLIIIDELGKFLEYEARTPQVNDIYLLQALAEHAQQAHDTPLQLVVLLHQAFEQYARGLGERLKNEWNKVQGRFESIAFLESGEQTIRIIQKALVHNTEIAADTALLATSTDAATMLSDHSALPAALAQAEAAQIFLHCYPLHPVTLLILPTLCQRIAQNERTLFSYLGSQEPHGFRDSLQRLDWREWILPWQLYDYFILNQPTSLGDPLTQKRWAEVISAVDRLGDELPAQVQLLKTIGLFNIIGSQGQFKASPEILQLCEPDPTHLAKLSAKSLIIYRNFNNEYRVWQGSDFNLEETLRTEVQQLGYLSIAEELNKMAVLMPLVARRHTFKTGTLRYFTPYFVDVQTLKQLPTAFENPPLLLFLVETPEEQAMFTQTVQAADSRIQFAIAGLFSQGEQLREIVTEVLALQRLPEQHKALHDDPIAQSEYKIRLAATEQLLTHLIKDIVRSPQRLAWYRQGDALSIANAVHFQVALSEVMDSIYHLTPILKNELINRMKPSTSAASGRNRLLVAMLKHSHEADLGITKYPPEKAIYRSILNATGLHRPIEGVWQFAPPPHDDVYRLHPTWQVIDSFFNECEAMPRPLADLFPRLAAAPYGITAGVSLILVVTALLVYQEELALYEEEMFVSAITQEIIERLRTDVTRFTVQRFKLEGMRASLFREYVKLLAEQKIESKPDVLSIAKPIAKFMDKLPEYTKQTQAISKEAQAVRESFFQAKSPNEFLLKGLPQACGYADFALEEEENHKLESFSNTLLAVLRELNTAYEKLLNTVQQRLKTAFGIESTLPIAELRLRLRGRYIELETYTVDEQGLKAFIKTLADDFGDDKQWLERLGAFLARVPIDRWRDSHIDIVDYKLAEFSKRLADLDRLRLFHESQRYHGNTEFEATLLRAVRKGKREQQTIAYTDTHMKTHIQKVCEKTAQHLKQQLPELEYRKSVIAHLLDQLLDEEQAAEKTVQPEG